MCKGIELVNTAQARQDMSAYTDADIVGELKAHLAHGMPLTAVILYNVLSNRGTLKASVLAALGTAINTQLENYDHG